MARGRRITAAPAPKVVPPPQKKAATAVVAAAAAALAAQAKTAKPQSKPKPMAKAKPRQQQQAKGATKGAARPSRKLYDPSHKSPVPSDCYQASAVNSPLRCVFNAIVPTKPALSSPVSGEGWRALVCSPNSSCNTSAVWLSVDNANQFVDVQMITPAMLRNTSETGGPISGRCQKAGVSICNVSNAYQRSGTVYSLATDRRLSIPGNLLTTGDVRTTSTEFYDWCQTVIGNPDTVTHTAAEFIKPRLFYCTPRDSIEYNKIRPWVAPEVTVVVDSFVDVTFRVPPTPAAVQSSTELVHHPMVMNALVFIFPPTGMGEIGNVLTGGMGSPQHYMITSLSQYWTRWPLESPMSTTARDIPVIDGKSLALATKESALHGQGKSQRHDGGGH